MIVIGEGWRLEPPFAQLFGSNLKSACTTMASGSRESTSVTRQIASFPCAKPFVLHRRDQEASRISTPLDGNRNIRIDPLHFSEDRGILCT